MSRMPVRDIFLVRHCQSEANVGGRLEAWGDSPLTALGVYQAGKLAEFVSGFGMVEASLLASPLQRAAQTAARLAEVLGCEAAHDERLREGNVGWLEGLAFTEVEEHQKTHNAKFISADLHGGESFKDVADRMEAAFREHLGKTAGPVVVVAHGYAIRALLWRLYGEDSTDAPRFKQPFGNGDVIAFKLEGAKPQAQFEHHVLAV